MLASSGRRPPPSSAGRGARSVMRSWKAIMAADSKPRERGPVRRHAGASARGDVAGTGDDARAIRATIGGGRGAGDLRDAAQRRARELGVLGWVRNAGDGSTTLHAEGSAAAVESLLAFL